MNTIARDIAQAAAQHYGCNLDQLLNIRHCQDSITLQAHQAACWGMAHMRGRPSHALISDWMRCDRKTVARAITRAEERAAHDVRYAMLLAELRDHG